MQDKIKKPGPLGRAFFTAVVFRETMSDNTQKMIFKMERGAATVEFAFALIGLFVFFGIFMQFAVFFIAEQRLAFAGFAGARTYAVEDAGKAIQTASAIEPEAGITLNGQLELTRNIPLPDIVADFLTGGENRFTIKHRSPAFKEPEYRDDNPDPF